MSKRSAFHSSIQKIASSGPGSWLFSKTLHYFDRGVLKLSKGRRSMSSMLAGTPLVMLTTTGAKSGLARTLPLLCIRHDSNDLEFAIIASNWGQGHHPAWLYNLRANPTATCSIDGQAGEFEAHEAEGEEYGAYWKSAMDTYLGYPTYKERAGDRHIPIIVMSPID